MGTFTRGSQRRAKERFAQHWDDYQRHWSAKHDEEIYECELCTGGVVHSPPQSLTVTFTNDCNKYQDGGVVSLVYHGRKPSPFEEWHPWAK